MSYFAKIENGFVTEVLSVEQEFIDTGTLGDPSLWIQCSYNTRGCVHYGQDGKPDGGVALRGNYPGIGYVYDKDADVFYLPTPPFPSWALNKNIWLWESPVPYPTDGKVYYWDEPTVAWQSEEN
jgi:hypothetical protein